MQGRYVTESKRCVQSVCWNSHLYTFSANSDFTDRLMQNGNWNKWKPILPLFLLGWTMSFNHWTSEFIQAIQVVFSQQVELTGGGGTQTTHSESLHSSNRALRYMYTLYSRIIAKNKLTWKEKLDRIIVCNKWKLHISFSKINCFKM